MPPAFLKIVTIANGERQQVWLEFGAFPLDYLEAIKVGGKELGTAPDGAQRADEMLLAETRRVQPDIVDGEVVPEVKVIPATLEEARGFDGRALAQGGQEIPHGNRPFLGSCIACYSAR